MTFLPEIDPDTEERISRYLDGTATVADRDRLEEAMQEDEALRSHFLARTRMDHHLAEEARGDLRGEEDAAPVSSARGNGSRLAWAAVGMNSAARYPLIAMTRPASAPRTK